MGNGRVPVRQAPVQLIAPVLHKFGNIVLDLRRAEVTRDDEPVKLMAREFCLFRYFAEHPGATLTCEELLQQVCGHRGEMFTRTVDMHVASLRQKLESSPETPEMIVTVPGIGYRLMG
jgi:DNA-binding response OmpR family regulator